MLVSLFVCISIHTIHTTRNSWWFGIKNFSEMRFKLKNIFHEWSEIFHISTIMQMTCSKSLNLIKKISQWSYTYEHIEIYWNSNHLTGLKSCNSQILLDLNVFWLNDRISYIESLHKMRKEQTFSIIISELSIVTN